MRIFTHGNRSKILTTVEINFPLLLFDCIVVLCDICICEIPNSIIICKDIALTFERILWFKNNFCVQNKFSKDRYFILFILV